MSKRQKLTLVAIMLILGVSAASFLYPINTKFMVEFGESNKVESGEAKSRRERFCQLLTEHSISYKIETDSFGRIWVVPDQSKFNEYEQVNKLWENKEAERVKGANEKNGL